MKINCRKYLTYVNNEVQKVIRKEFINATLFMFGLYTFAIIGIIRADILYWDDLNRKITGYRGWVDWGRHISEFLAVFLHADTYMIDISPLTQITAALFMAIASVLLVYVTSGGKVTKTACLLALPMGLSPYFLECFSYRFGAEGMALSVLVSIVPFLFIRNYTVFSVSSIISQLIMCMTYQASSGIYIIIVIMLCFKAWNERKKTNREIFRFAVVSALSYCVAMIFFRVVLVPGNNNDRYWLLATGILPINGFFAGIINNFVSYMKHVNEDFALIWKFLLFILCLTFIIASVLFTKRNRIVALIVSFMVVTAMSVMSFGVYLALATPMFFPRTLLGFGVFIACIAVYLSNIPKKIVLLPAVLLCWCFFVFSFTYGNALSEQKRYNNFRTEILLHDLSMLFPEKTEYPLLIRLVNSEGFAPSIRNISLRNPVIRRLVPINLEQGNIWGYIFLTSYYNFNLQMYEGIEEDGSNVLFDTQYHTIKIDSMGVFVILK